MMVPEPVSPGSSQRAARIERAGFCTACATACADGEVVGFLVVAPVCDTCRGRTVPVSPLARVPTAYHAQRWASGRT